METTYYTCRNQHCPRYKNIFLEGDPMHANCAHERLRFDEERSGMPVWALIAIPAGIAAIAAALIVLRSRMKAPGTETTRGSEPLAREGERHSVPPPIGRQM